VKHFDRAVVMMYYVTCSGLDKHMSKIHLGIRPYICDKCGNSFSDEPELRTHIARHSEKKPYSCDFCQYSTYQKASLKCKYPKYFSVSAWPGLLVCSPTYCEPVSSLC